MLLMHIYFIVGLLITASKDANNKYTYNTTTVVILVELGKLLFVLIMLFREYV